MRNRVMTIVGMVLALGVVAAAVVVVVDRIGGEDAERTSLAAALRLAPPDGVRFSWTDWTGVRRQVGLELTAASPGPAVQDLLDRGFEADLTPSSALGSSAIVMQERLGFSPATLDWELFTQGPGIAALTMRAGPELDYDFVASSLRETGYDEPDDADGVWEADPERDDITSQVTPELNFIALDRERGLLFASDTDAGIRGALEAAGADDTEALAAALVDAAGAPLSASLYTGDQVCSALAMAHADPSEEQAGTTLIAAAGEVNPITGFAIGADAAGDVRVAMSFETEEQARTNATTRAVLATGPAPGQGGDFADRFTLESSRATGRVVTLDLTPQPGAYVLSDLSTGPVLFATC
ncbi:hypothetical protein BH09ACT12_BH09ACT12_31210 [soil metagenome]